MIEKLVIAEPIEEWKVYVSFESEDTLVGVIRRGIDNKFSYFPRKFTEMTQSDLNEILKKVKTLNDNPPYFDLD